MRHYFLLITISVTCLPFFYIMLNHYIKETLTYVILFLLLTPITLFSIFKCTYGQKSFAVLFVTPVTAVVGVVTHEFFSNTHVWQHKNTLPGLSSRSYVQYKKVPFKSFTLLSFDSTFFHTLILMMTQLYRIYSLVCEHLKYFCGQISGPVGRLQLVKLMSSRVKSEGAPLVSP